MSRWPLWAASNKGVTPSIFALSLAAPISTRNCTMSRWPLWAASNKGVAPLMFALSLAAPTSTRNCTMSRWPLWAASNKGVAPVFVAWSLAAPCSAKKRTVVRWLLEAAAIIGVCPWAHSGVSVFAPASSNSSISWTCPCSAAWNRGVLPSLFASLGFLGCCSSCSRATKSLTLDAEIIFCVSSSSGGQNSKTTSWILSGAGSKISSSWISREPSSTKNLCLNLEMPTLAAKAFFTALAVLPCNSSSRTVSVSPDVRKHTSIAASS